MELRKPYPSDVSDHEWAFAAPYLALVREVDVEDANLTGEITKLESDDPRGPRFTIVDLSSDRRVEVGVVRRFTTTMMCLIITVCGVSD